MPLRRGLIVAAACGATAELLYDCQSGLDNCGVSWSTSKKNYCYLVHDIRCGHTEKRHAEPKPAAGAPWYPGGDRTPSDAAKITPWYKPRPPPLEAPSTPASTVQPVLVPVETQPAPAPVTSRAASPPTLMPPWVAAATTPATTARPTFPPATVPPWVQAAATTSAAPASTRPTFPPGTVPPWVQAAATTSAAPASTRPTFPPATVPPWVQAAATTSAAPSSTRSPTLRPTILRTAPPPPPPPPPTSTRTAPPPPPPPPPTFTQTTTTTTTSTTSSTTSSTTTSTTGFITVAATIAPVPIVPVTFTTQTQTTTRSGTFLMPGQAPIEYFGAVSQRLSKEPWESSPVPPPVCQEERFSAPRPEGATDLNGVILPPVCFQRSPGPHHVFVIGDWGGISQAEGMIPRPADHRSKKFKDRHRKFVLGADNCAQVSVAMQMEKRALEKLPDYVLNVGDNFYWGGVDGDCGTPVAHCRDVHGQWDRVFERVYGGPGMAQRQWLGVLGNHDFGGYRFSSGWDQAIAYTWVTGGKSSGRWFTPALYWGQQVRYSDFSVDYFFVDTNTFDAFNPLAHSTHNICSAKTNPKNATCGTMGPMGTMDCPDWFLRNWQAQLLWLDKGLSKSASDWQIVVTHFPPEFGENDWRRLTYTHGIDVLICGHRHQQEVHYLPANDFLYPTAYLVSGGGGGITSEATPDADGNDDQYGFMDLTLAKDEIMVEAISHAGALRSRTCLAKRDKMAVAPLSVGRSMCAGLDKGPLPAPPRVGSKLGPSDEVWG